MRTQVRQKDHRTFDVITLEILWARLQSIVDSAAASLQRTAFSQLIREGKDCGSVLLDAKGNIIAQSRESAASVLTLKFSVRKVLETYAKDSLQPGDVVISNDPWICSGHLNDVHAITPIFDHGRLVALAGCFAHWADIGGRPLSSENREYFEEGILIPLSKIIERGKFNGALFNIIMQNIRAPQKSKGDFWAQVAANQVASDGLLSMIKEFELNDIGALFAETIRRSEQSARAAVKEIPDGVYTSEVRFDGYDTPLTIKTAITVKGTDLTIDYAGSSPQGNHSLNSVYNFTYGYSVVPLKYILAPNRPGNEGCFNPLTIKAPMGSIVNAAKPIAVGHRVLIGHFLHASIYRALAEVIPEKVQADSGSCPNWSSAWISIGKEADKSFTQLLFNAGGQGARPNMDGNSCTPFPSNVNNAPIEVVERECPVRFERKEYRCDSGGAGQFRGGLGQRIDIRCLSDTPVLVTVRCDRVLDSEHAAKGLFGGKPGALGAVMVNGKQVNPKTEKLLGKNDVLTLETPGGGGYGNAAKRDPEKISWDIRNGFISA